MPRAKVDLPEKPIFVCEIPVRITDVNYGGHVGNDSLLSLLHEARVQFLAHLGYSEKDIEGKGIIMTDAVLVYKAQVFYGEKLRIEIGVQDLQRHGLDITYKLISNQKEVARAKTGIAFFDYANNAVASMPDKFKNRFTDTDVL